MIWAEGRRRGRVPDPRSLARHPETRGKTARAAVRYTGCTFSKGSRPARVKCKPRSKVSEVLTLMRVIAVGSETLERR